MSDYARELEVAGFAAREAGAVILGHYARGSIAVETKADASGPPYWQSTVLRRRYAVPSDAAEA